jgi:hypothetical protein
MNETEQQAGGEPQADKTAADAPAAEAPPADGIAPNPGTPATDADPANPNVPQAGEAQAPDTFGNEGA